MTKRWLTASLIAVGVAVAALWAGESLKGLLLGMLAGTTTDPRSLGLTQSPSMAPVRATLRTDVLMDTPVPGGDSRLIKGDYRLTFEAPAAYYSAIGRPSAERGMQAVAFKFWSRTGDPVAPDLIEQRRRCERDGKLVKPCSGDPVQKRLDTGEWEIEVEMFNAVETPAERYRLLEAQLHRARSITESCSVYEDAQLGMTVVTVPESEYPPTIDAYVPLPNFCGGIYIIQGERGRQRDGTTNYYPPRIFYKFDDAGAFRFRVSCRAIGSSLCTMSVNLGNWSGRMWVSYSMADKWDKSHSLAVEFLSRHVKSRTID